MTLNPQLHTIRIYQFQVDYISGSKVKIIKLMEDNIRTSLYPWGSKDFSNKVQPKKKKLGFIKIRNFRPLRDVGKPEYRKICNTHNWQRIHFIIYNKLLQINKRDQPILKIGQITGTIIIWKDAQLHVLIHQRNAN